VFAGAFAAIYLEVSLVKLMAVKFYSIFAYAIIGVALLGYGAAGSLLAIRRLTEPVAAPGLIARWLIAFAATAVPAFLAVNAIDTPMHELFGSFAGLPVLLAIYTCLILPFFLVGLAMCLAFSAFPRDANRLYFADLLGAGLGSALAVASLPAIGGTALVAAAASVGALGAALAARTAGQSRWPALVVGGINVLLVGIFAGLDPIEVRIAADKHGPIISRSAKPGGLATTFSGWSVLGRVDVTEPFDTLPPQFGGDVSRVFGKLRIEQRMLTLDGAAPAFMYRVDHSPKDIEFLSGTSQSPAYRLRPHPRVLVIGMGGATDVLISLHHDATRVVAVELNPVTVAAARDVYGAYMGGVLDDPRVEIVVAEGRHFVASHDERYDIVQLSGVDTGAAVGAYGLGTMPESYIYTVEAMTDFIHRLAPDGILSITRDLQYGWALRLSSLARAALLAEGLEPGPRIAVLEGQGWGWATVLVKREPFTPAEISALEDFSERYRFPLAYNPLLVDSGAFHRAIRTGATVDGNTDLRPATDDWPFYFLSFRWDRLRSAFAGEHRPLLKPIAFLIASLCGLAVMSVVLIGAPLWRLRAGWRETHGKGALVGYFAFLGVGFMVVEVALMQRFTLFLGNPVLAVASVLAALLASSGLGSYAARMWQIRRERAVPLAVAWIVLAQLFFASPVLRGLLAGPLFEASLGVRLVVCAALVAAVGVPMGIPFPAGIARVAERAANFVPWAWGINGLLSVIASLLSYLIGIVFGYTPMFYLGAVLYGGVLVLSRRL
jgi:hypothetical protein